MPKTQRYPDYKICTICQTKGVEHWLPDWVPLDVDHDPGSDHLIRVLADLAYYATLPTGEPGPPGED